MSSFNGVDLFGSGKHRVTFEDTQVDSHEFAFTGDQGAFQVVHGWRGENGAIRGHLRGATPAAIMALKSAIVAHYTAGTCGTLIDGYGISYTDVVIKGFKWTGNFEKSLTTGTWLREYECKVKKLKP